MAHQNIGVDVLNRIKEDTAEIASVEAFLVGLKVDK